MADIKVNRINRNFTIKVHLYFNKDSYNRVQDTTPRYYIKPVKLLNVEKAAFTSEGARAQGYTKYGNRFYKWVNDDTLTDAKCESIFAEIQNSYPYGYVEGDTASFNKWYIDVKTSQSFQSFYKTYWENNETSVVQPQSEQGVLNYPHPYIEFTVNEIITYKHNTGTIPALPVGESLWGEYKSDVITDFYTQETDTSCLDGISNLYLDSTSKRFQIDGITKLPLRISATGRHRIDIKSGTSDNYITWPTGSDGTFSGYRFRMSTGVEGTSNSYLDYEQGVSYPVSPERGHFLIKAIEKTAVAGGNDDGHPYMYAGHATGYAISGSGDGTTATGINISGFGYDEGANLTLRRDSTYSFWQTDASNDDYYMQISTDPSGGWGNDTDSRIFKTGVTNVTGFLEFTVPYTAPDTLYYVDRDNAYMGGRISIVDAPASTYTGSKPGESIVINSTNALEQTMFYYSPDLSGMGGVVFMQSGCDDTAPQVI